MLYLLPFSSPLPPRVYLASDGARGGRGECFREYSNALEYSPIQPWLVEGRARRSAVCVLGGEISWEMKVLFDWPGSFSLTRTISYPYLPITFQ